LLLTTAEPPRPVVQSAVRCLALYLDTPDGSRSIYTCLTSLTNILPTGNTPVASDKMCAYIGHDADGSECSFTQSESCWRRTGSECAVIKSDVKLTIFCRLLRTLNRPSIRSGKSFDPAMTYFIFIRIILIF
jgi:hypothetical protein